MSNWNEGYMSQINYTTGYYRELSPSQCITSLLMANLAPPSAILDGKFNACELGFGMGLSLNIHAAAMNAKWYATDFNPSHALFARHLAEHTNADKLVIADQAFQEFCVRDDLPEFDYIGLHGIWSWISETNKQAIVDFIKRKLKVGGILYISYNTLPGWSAHASLRHLLHHFYQTDRHIGKMTDNVASAIAQTETLLSHSQSLTTQVPFIQKHLDQIKQQNPQYVAHEYFNQHWQPLYFSEMAQVLGEAKLQFACSSSYLDDCELILFSAEQQSYLAEISDPILRQTAKDFLLNTPFRRDLWVKGKRELSQAQLTTHWQGLRILLTKPRAEVEGTIGQRINITLNPTYLNALLDILQDHQPHLVGNLMTQLKEVVSPEALFKLLAMLNARGDIATAISEENMPQRQAECNQLNAKIHEQLFTPNQMNTLASPVTGSGFTFDDIELLFIDAHRRRIAVSDWESEAAATLKRCNKLLMKEGNVLEGDEETRQELSQRKARFIQDSLPMLIQLKILNE